MYTHVVASLWQIQSFSSSCAPEKLHNLQSITLLPKFTSFPFSHFSMFMDTYHYRGSTEDDGAISRPGCSSDRLNSRPKLYGRPYTPTIIRPKRRKTKTRTAASQIVNMLHPGNRPLWTSNTNSVVRRSTGKRRMSVNLEDYTDSSGTDDNNLMNPKYRTHRFRRAKNYMDNSASQDELLPWREGLQGYEGDEDGEEDGDDEEGEEQEGRRRYDLRNRDVPRLSIEEGKKRPRSPRRVLHQGMGTKVNKDVRRGGSRVHKRHRLTRADDTLVDELDQGPPIPWGRGGSRARPPRFFGGLEMHGATAWGFNVAASGWGNQNDSMSTITPATQRGSIVHSRPLSSVVASCLQGQLQKAMNVVADVFPPFVVSPELAKLSMLSYGSTIPPVYRPRLLLCGGEGVGLDHVGPAILHELEKFPVHSLGLPSLLSDPRAKTPEEALVHIFREARRTTPSILYLPQFHLWWENAHEQLRAVLLTLLEELPSDLPIFLFGTSSKLLDDLPKNPSLVFPPHNIFHLTAPSFEDRYLFIDCLIGTALSIQYEDVTEKPSQLESLPELPKAPNVAFGPKVSELKAKAETEGHALRRLRMCLRDVCNWILYDKRFSVFHFPVMDEDALNYRSIIQYPMDMATLLQHVDSGKYMTCKSFLKDFDLIVANAKKYIGNDYNGARIVSRAYELRDVVHEMLSQMDPALVAVCEKIADEGGPVSMPDELGSSALPQTPAVHTTTHADHTIECKSEDVIMLDGEDDIMLDGEQETIKEHFLERTNAY